MYLYMCTLRSLTIAYERDRWRLVTRPNTQTNAIPLTIYEKRIYYLLSLIPLAPPAIRGNANSSQLSTNLHRIKSYTILSHSLSVALLTLTHADHGEHMQTLHTRSFVRSLDRSLARSCIQHRIGATHAQPISGGLTGIELLRSVQFE